MLSGTGDDRISSKASAASDSGLLLPLDTSAASTATGDAAWILRRTIVYRGGDPGVGLLLITRTIRWGVGGDSCVALWTSVIVDESRPLGEDGSLIHTVLFG